jgi:hypothetical protein
MIGALLVFLRQQNNIGFADGLRIGKQVSPVSRALAKIRQKARLFFEQS